MVQFKILSGIRAGAVQAATGFPCSIGRAAGAGLRLEESGIWDQHAQLDFKAGDGFVLRLQGSALATVNGQPFQEARLRNGDVIELGSVKLQFWLGEVEQRPLARSELLVWLVLGAATVGQVLLLLLLSR
jgi:pSer/pThr/pTyr-binding forkhead associated (FHA) protein